MIGPWPMAATHNLAEGLRTPDLVAENKTKLEAGRPGSSSSFVLDGLSE